MGRLDIESGKMPFALIWYNVRPKDPCNRQRIKYIIIQREKKDNIECKFKPISLHNNTNSIYNNTNPLDECKNETKLFRVPSQFIYRYTNSFSCVAHIEHLIYLESDYGDKIIYNEHDTFIEFFNEENDIHVEVL